MDDEVDVPKAAGTRLLFTWWCHYFSHLRLPRARFWFNWLRRHTWCLCCGSRLPELGYDVTVVKLVQNRSYQLNFHFHQRCLVYCGIYWCRMSYMTVKVGSLVFWHIQICIQRADSMFLFSCSHIFGFVTFASVHTWLIQCQPAQVKVCSEDWQALGNNCLFEGKILPWILMSSLQSLSNASIVSRVASTGTILWPWPRW